MKNEPNPVLPTPSLKDRFDEAASYVSSSTTSNQIGVEAQLRLYGLYKIVKTEGQDPTSSSLYNKINFWDFEGNAKQKSWKLIWKELNKKANNNNKDSNPAASLVIIDNPSSQLQNNSNNIASLAAIEYIEYAKRLGWSELDFFHNKKPGLDDHQESLDGIKPENQHLYEILKQNYKNDQQQNLRHVQEEVVLSSRNVVERDEYGIEILEGSSPTTTNEASQSGTSTPSGTLKSFTKIAGPSVSKLIPNESEFSLNRTETSASHHTENNHQAGEDQPSSLLHDIVLDFDHTHLQNHLVEIRSNILDLKQFHDTINRYHNGYTAFHLACDRGDLEKVKLLKEYGVDVSLKDEFDQLDGVQLAREAGMLHIVQFLSQ